jgi:hypothetical protein
LLRNFDIFSYNICLIGVMKQHPDRKKHFPKHTKEDIYSQLSSSSSDYDDTPNLRSSPTTTNHVEIKISEQIVFLNPGTVHSLYVEHFGRKKSVQHYRLFTIEE